MHLPPLLPAQFLSREKRFLIHTNLGVAHCPNTGSLKTILDQPITRVWLRDHGEGTTRKLRYTAEILEFENGEMAVINTARANDLAKEALTERQIPSLATYKTVKMEAKWDAQTRFDALLTEGPKQCWVEVKSSTLQWEGGAASFPDSPSTRGQKHLQVLMEAVQQGHAAAQVYIVMREGATHFRPAHEIDPTYAKLLAQAQAAGVQVIAHQTTITRNAEGAPISLTLGPALPLVIPQ